MEGKKENDPAFSHFATLPVELFLHICSFLDISDMVHTLKKVCTRFNEILQDENIYKAWIAKRWNARYPIVSAGSEYFDWIDACLDIEKHWKTWRCKETFRYINASDVHISSTDAIIFLNTPSTCVSASRDRSIVVWNPLKENLGRPAYYQKLVAHEGWIWRLHYMQGALYSCSWDATVKEWSTSSSALHNISTFRCSSPVLSLSSLDGLIIAGDYGRTVYAFDPRSKPEPQFTYSTHQRAVLTLGTFKSDIISGSEDKTLAIWDNRTRSVRQQLLISKMSYPNCSFVDSGILYVGDSIGMIHVISAMNDKANFIQSFQVGHHKTISCVKHGKGYLLTSSLDGSMRISIPSDPPHCLATIKSTGGEVGGADYFDGMLAAASAELIEFWIPEKFMDSCQ